jgi:DNA-binding CsgD family transcriptional regulator
MNKYEPISSGLFSALLQDAAFDGTLLGTLATEMGRLLPPSVVVSILSENRHGGGFQTIIHPPQAAGPPQRVGRREIAFERALEGTVYAGRCGTEDLAPDRTESHVRLVLRSSKKGRYEVELRFPSRKADHQQAELMRFLQTIGPDLVLAFRIAELTERVFAAERLTDDLLDLLPFPTLLLDRCGGLRRSNTKGGALLAKGAPIIAGPDGRIHAAHRTSNDSFQEAIGRQQDKQAGAEGICRTIALPAGERPVLMTIRHLCRPGGSPSVSTFAPPNEEEPATILIAQPMTGALALRRDILEATFDLTGKEAELAQSLLNGESIGTYAQRRKMSKQTLRNQLSGILRKTKTTRQAELIGLLTRFAFAPTA